MEQLKQREVALRRCNVANKVAEAGVYGWTKTGAKVWVEHCFDNGERLVRSVLESVYDYDGDEQEVLGELRVVEGVWDAAPTEVYDKRIKALEKKVVELEREAVQKRLEISEMEAEFKVRSAKYTAIPELRQLDQFIAGKITHYVHVQKWYSPRIMAFSDEVSEYTDNERGLNKMRLLSLFGKSNGDLEWSLNQWNDGSGSKYEVIPCCSLEEAQAVLQVEFDKRFVDSASATLLKDAETAGVQVPDDFRQRVRDEQIKQARKTVDELSAKVIEANKKLTEVQRD